MTETRHGRNGKTHVKVIGRRNFFSAVLLSCVYGWELLTTGATRITSVMPVLLHPK